MPVPPRQAVPSLLQVDAILVHLSGAAALDEVCRFLGAELPGFASLAIYRPDGTSWRRMTNVDALADGTESWDHVPEAAARALADGRTAIVGGSGSAGADGVAQVAVPIVSAGRTIAVLYGTSALIGGFDATDGRFLEKVAEKVRGAVDAASVAGGSPTG